MSRKTIIVVLECALFFAFPPFLTRALAPQDVGMHEGQLVSSSDLSNPDVFVLNAAGYKRLFLNPVIFGFYGHLGGFPAIIKTAPGILNSFPTSFLYRNCETNDLRVFQVEVIDDDDGILHWLNLSGPEAVQQDKFFFDKVFCINSNEFNWYAQGSVYAALNKITTSPTATPTPENTSSWKTYTNNTYHFSVRYPTTWTVNSVLDQLATLTSNAVVPFDILIAIKDAAGVISLREYWLSAKAPVAETLTDVTIGSLPGLKITSTAGSTLLVLRNGSLYTFASGTELGRTKFDAIISTLSFQ